MKPIDYLTTWLPILYGIHPNDLASTVVLALVISRENVDSNFL